LSSNRMRSAGAVLVAETLHLVALLSECGCGRGSCEPGTNYDDLELSLVGGADEVRVVFIVRPLLSKGTFGDVGIQCHCGLPNPKIRMEIGMDM
jgi:hypothetical protein